eukprot:scaffold170055_cov30-Tisochrysis_lutea.AAC.3
MVVVIVHDGRNKRTNNGPVLLGTRTCTRSSMSCNSSASSSLRRSASSNSDTVRALSFSSSCKASTASRAAVNSARSPSASAGPESASRQARASDSSTTFETVPPCAVDPKATSPRRSLSTSARAAFSCDLRRSACSCNCSCESRVFTTAALRIVFARVANCSVDFVSDSLSAEGEQATSSSVLELPPRDS